MSWSHHIVDSLSGERLSEVFPTTPRWQTIANSVGDGEHAFLLSDEQNDLGGDMDASRAIWRGMMRKWARTLVVSWNGIAVYAGLIDYAYWRKDTKVLTVRHRELRAMLIRRHEAMVINFDKNAAWAVRDKSLRGAARAFVVRGLTTAGVTNWGFPLVVPTIADDAGPHSFLVWHRDFDSFESLLKQVTDRDDGPDVAFDPVWTADGRLQWWLRLGSPQLPGETFEFNTAAPEHPVVDFTEHEDGTRQLSGIFALGEGSGADQIVGKAGPLPGPPMPDMDGTRSHRDARDLATANARARGDLAAVRSPIVSQQFGLRLDGDDPLPLGAEFRIGARTRVYVPADEYLEAGWRDGYVLSMSGGDSEAQIAVEVQPL